MTVEKLPCGHEIDEEKLRMAQALAKVKAQGVEVIMAQVTCRENKDHPDGKPIKWQLVPRHWRRIVPKTRTVGNDTLSTAQGP